MRSENGVLNATLPGGCRARAAGRLRIPGLLYNDSYLPPLLRVQLGDTLRITFRKCAADDPSNLHYHGMSVSPQGNSDNVFVHVHPGQFEIRRGTSRPSDGRARALLVSPAPAWRRRKQILAECQAASCRRIVERHSPC